MSFSGKRLGAGHPIESRRALQPIRASQSRVDEFKLFLKNSLNQSLPYYSCKVRAGFPSPAEDYIELRLDLNAYLIKHPAATFFVIASGDSMQNAGIQSGDMLIVDRSLNATHGKIVIAAIDGELTVKRLSHKRGKVQLLPENNRYPPIDITHEQELVIWGVVTHVIHQTE